MPQQSLGESDKRTHTQTHTHTRTQTHTHTPTNTQTHKHTNTPTHTHTHTNTHTHTHTPHTRIHTYTHARNIYIYIYMCIYIYIYIYTYKHYLLEYRQSGGSMPVYNECSLVTSGIQFRRGTQHTRASASLCLLNSAFMFIRHHATSHAGDEEGKIQSW